MGITPAPTNQRVAITSEQLCDLYLVKGLTIEQVAARFGLASITISRRMRDLDIKARRRGPAPSTHGRCSSTTNGFEWSSELAYAVGLIATDGCLGRDKSHMTMTSKDIDLLETFKRCLGIKTGRLSRTSTVTTPSRRLGTSTRESICRLFRRVRHSSTGYADSPTTRWCYR